MENWKFALSSILGHKMRSFLTMLGVIIGVAAVVIIVALGNGINAAFTKMLTKDQQNVSIFYSAKKSAGGKGIITQEEMMQEAQDNGFSEETTPVEPPVVQEAWVKELTKLDGIDGYYVTNGTTATIGRSNDNKKADGVSVTGINATYFKIKKLEMVAGRNLTQADYQNYARVTLFDDKLAEKLFGGVNQALNQLVTIGENTYRVIGIYKDPDAQQNQMMGMNNGNALMTNTQLAAEFNVPEISSIYVHVTDRTRTLEVGSSAARRLTQIANVKEGEYQVFDISSALDSVNGQVLGFQIVMGAIGGISLVVGGIGVMNIMLVSVTERTREIGLRKALGATRGKVLSQFLIESMVLTSLGGLIGLGLASLIVLMIGHSLDSLFGGPPVVTLSSAVGSLIFSAVIGVIFGVLPANKASKLNPIEALRYE